jgi:hypothetical protein
MIVLDHWCWTIGQLEGPTTNNNMDHCYSHTRSEKQSRLVILVQEIPCAQGDEAPAEMSGRAGGKTAGTASVPAHDERHGSRVSAVKTRSRAST